MNARVWNETAAHIAAEQATIKAAAKRWRCDAIKLPVVSGAYGVDYRMERNGKIIAWVEVKCRRIPSRARTEYFLSRGKWQAGCELARTHPRTLFVLLVAFDDVTMWLDCTAHQPHRFGWGGRNDRKQPGDMEMCAWFSMRLFQRLY